MAKPRKKLNQTQLDNLEYYASRAASMEYMAQLFGMSRETFSKIRKEEPEIEEIIQRSRAKTYILVVSKLMDLIEQGDRASIFFWLKCQAGWSETKSAEDIQNNTTVTLKVVDSKGNPVTTDINSDGI